MIPEIAAEEYSQRDMLAAVDPGQTFLLYPQRICEPEAFEPTNQLEKCTRFPWTQKYINETGQVAEKVIPADEGQIVEYSFGGTDLVHLVLTRENRIPVLQGFERLIQGLMKLHAAGIYHHDIKLDNLVIDSTETPPRIRFIDFGLSVTGAQMIERLASPAEQGRQMADYYVWPYEVRFLPLMAREVVPPIPAVFASEAARKKFQETRNYASRLFKDAFHLDEPPSEEDVRALYDSIKALPTPLERVMYILERCDVYSLGIVLAVLMRRAYNVFLLNRYMYMWSNTEKKSVQIPLEHPIYTQLTPMMALVLNLIGIPNRPRFTATDCLTYFRMGFNSLIAVPATMASGVGSKRTISAPVVGANAAATTTATATGTNASQPNTKRPRNKSPSPRRNVKTRRTHRYR